MIQKATKSNIVKGKKTEIFTLRFSKITTKALTDISYHEGITKGEYIRQAVQNKMFD